MPFIGVSSAERRTVASSVAGASEAAAWWTRQRLPSIKLYDYNGDGVISMDEMR